MYNFNSRPLKCYIREGVYYTIFQNNISVEENLKNNFVLQKSRKSYELNRKPL